MERKRYFEVAANTKSQGRVVFFRSSVPYAADCFFKLVKNRKFEGAGIELVETVTPFERSVGILNQFVFRAA